MIEPRSPPSGQDPPFRQMPADRNAENVQPVPDAVVGLHQNADRVVLAADCDPPRCGTGAALELVADHARAAAAVALHDRARFQVGERIEHVLLRERLPVDVV
jgi:hypothetical protein